MKLRTRTTGVALVLTLSAAGMLAGCGSDDESGSTEDSTSQSDKTSKPDSSESDSSDKSDGDKPSRDDVVAGYTKVTNDTLSGSNLPQDTIDSVVTCFVDEIYDDASPETLQGIADSDLTKVDPADAQLFGDASTTCASKISGQ